MSSAPFKYLIAGHKHLVRHSISIMIKKVRCQFAYRKTNTEILQSVNYMQYQYNNDEKF